MGNKWSHLKTQISSYNAYLDGENWQQCKKEKGNQKWQELQIIYASSLKFSKFLGEKKKESFIIYFYVHIQK